MLSLTFTVPEEIALEGLDGITFDGAFEAFLKFFWNRKHFIASYSSLVPIVRTDATSIAS